MLYCGCIFRRYYGIMQPFCVLSYHFMPNVAGAALAYNTPAYNTTHYYKENYEPTPLAGCKAFV